LHGALLCFHVSLYVLYGSHRDIIPLFVAAAIMAPAWFTLFFATRERASYMDRRRTNAMAPQKGCPRPSGRAAANARLGDADPEGVAMFFKFFQKLDADPRPVNDPALVSEYGKFIHDMGLSKFVAGMEKAVVDYEWQEEVDELLGKSILAAVKLNVGTRVVVAAASVAKPEDRDPKAKSLSGQEVPDKAENSDEVKQAEHNEAKQEEPLEKLGEEAQEKAPTKRRNAKELKDEHAQNVAYTRAAKPTRNRNDYYRTWRTLAPFSTAVKQARMTLEDAVKDEAGEDELAALRGSFAVKQQALVAEQAKLGVNMSLGVGNGTKESERVRKANHLQKFSTSETRSEAAKARGAHVRRRKSKGEERKEDMKRETGEEEEHEQTHKMKENHEAAKKEKGKKSEKEKEKEKKREKDKAQKKGKNMEEEKQKQMEIKKEIEKEKEQEQSLAAAVKAECGAEIKVELQRGQWWKPCERCSRPCEALCDVCPDCNAEPAGSQRPINAARRGKRKQEETKGQPVARKRRSRSRNAGVDSTDSELPDRVPGKRRRVIGKRTL
jgi:hypothetical protein